VGFSRANLFGHHFETYQQEAQAPLLVAMIEHQRAVKNLDEILAVEGLDAILIGPYDLSASMGLTAQFEHSDFQEAMGQILEKATLSKVPAGVHVVQPSESQLEQRITEGYRFLAYSIDAVMLRHATATNLKSRP
jgi:2-dehydro-3-deoxyglucarate aldolase